MTKGAGNMNRNVIIVSDWVWNCKMPSQIFPLRLANAFKLCGWNCIGIQSEHEYVPEEERGFHKYSWGDCATVSPDQVLSTLDQILEHLPEPHLVIVANTINQGYYDLGKKHDIPIVPFQSDPFYMGLPPKDQLEAAFGQATFALFNEGHPVNYIRDVHPELGEKCHVINHALDLTIAPDDREFNEIKKEYLASCCAGLETRRHKQLIRLFYVPSLSFPGERFVVAGSLDRRFPKHIMADPLSGLSIDEIKKYSDFDFNIETKSEEIKNPVAGSQAGVQHWNPATKKYEPWFGGGLSWHGVHRLYAASLFGVNIYGDYLARSPYAYRMFGTKLFEQLGSGAAVITNHISGIEDLVLDGKTGFIVETTKGAIDAYRYGVDNPDEVKEMGQAARQRILKNHTWNHRVKEIEKILRGA